MPEQLEELVPQHLFHQLEQPEEELQQLELALTQQVLELVQKVQLVLVVELLLRLGPSFHQSPFKL